MKKLIALTALAATTATGAFAMANAQANLNTIHDYAPSADVSTLSDADILALLNIIHSGDSESEKQMKVRAALR